MCERGLEKRVSFRSKILTNFRQNLCQNFRKKGFEKRSKILTHFQQVISWTVFSQLWAPNLLN